MCRTNIFLTTTVNRWRRFSDTGSFSADLGHLKAFLRGRHWTKCVCEGKGTSLYYPVFPQQSGHLNYRPSHHKLASFAIKLHSRLLLACIILHLYHPVWKDLALLAPLGTGAELSPAKGTESTKCFLYLKDMEVPARHMLPHPCHWWYAETESLIHLPATGLWEMFLMTDALKR